MELFQQVYKAYTEGIYADTPANRKLGRVGMTYQQYAEKLKIETKDKKENISLFDKYLNEIEDNKDEYPKNILNVNKNFLEQVKKEYKNLQNLSLEEKKKISPLSNPSLYTAASRTSKEKLALINILKDKGQILQEIPEDEYNSGISIIAKIKDNIISINGLSVKTNLKQSKSTSKYLGIPGSKRWYGGGTYIVPSNSTKEFSVYDKENINDLIKSLKL